jgi:hypothetical protein
VPRSVILSVLFHLAVFVLGYVGLPGLKPPPPLTETPIMVEVVDVSDITRAPPPKREDVKKPEPKKQPPKQEAEPEPAPEPEPPAPPEPPKRAETPPPPPPEPEPEPEIAAVPPPPQPKPEAKKKPEPKPEPKAKPKPKASPVLAKVVPKRKPKAPDAFASVLKTVKALKNVPLEKKPAPTPKGDFEASIAKALNAPSARGDTVEKVTISEIDLVKQQIARCWNVQGGYKGIEEMSVEIWVAMNPDGTVRQARILDAARFANDPFKKAFAESAYRAVLNKRCQPFKLPAEKYTHWKTMKLNFDPRDML